MTSCIKSACLYGIDGFVVDFGLTTGIAVFIDINTDAPHADGAIFRRCHLTTF